MLHALTARRIASHACRKVAGGAAIATAIAAAIAPASKPSTVTTLLAAVASCWRRREEHCRKWRWWCIPLWSTHGDPGE